MKIYLATFYSFDLKRSAERFKKQAQAMNIYDYIHLFNPNDLNDDFKNYVSSLLKMGKHRGYGHWVWQTYVHQLILKKMNEGDIYHWCDVGCHFNINGVIRLKEYIDFVLNEKNGFLGFSYKRPDVDEKYKNYKFESNYEYQYTKADLLKFFNLKKDDKIVNTPQVWGGSFFVRKCSNSNEILNDHFEITRNRYDLIDDDENKFIEKSLPGFVAHRHSQSVLSILLKKKNCQFLSAYESEWALDENGQRTFDHTRNFPIIAKRDKQKNIFKRFLDRQKKNIKRKFNFFKNL
tara:strand:+ start:679 stop:1551 length:873 start_codon:yes stop_codon:yes gene_type:complete